jgi:hypothetical protein
LLVEDVDDSWQERRLVVEGEWAQREQEASQLALVLVHA